LKLIPFITLHLATKNLKFVGKFYVSWCPNVIKHQMWENKTFLSKVIGHGIEVIKKCGTLS
jgi:hypothetical protein